MKERENNTKDHRGRERERERERKKERDPRYKETKRKKEAVETIKIGSEPSDRGTRCMF